MRFQHIRYQIRVSICFAGRRYKARFLQDSDMMLNSLVIKPQRACELVHVARLPVQQEKDAQPHDAAARPTYQQQKRSAQDFFRGNEHNINCRGKLKKFAIWENLYIWQLR